MDLRLLMSTYRVGFQRTILTIFMVTLLIVAAEAQNCTIDFPGISILNLSAICGPNIDNLTLGKNVPIGNGDVFTFNHAVVNISGNLKVEASGSGKLVIPMGVTVIVDGNFQLDSKNSGCTSANACTFEIEVLGTLHIKQNIQNNLVTVLWSGSGKVIADNQFKNSSNGCMQCGTGGCPSFDLEMSKCKDDRPGCLGGSFCETIEVCTNDKTPPAIHGCPSDITVNITASCDGVVDWTPPTFTDDCLGGTITSNKVPGSTFNKGITVVTYTATDASGNTSTCSFNVTVNDKTPPVISGCPTNITVSANAACEAVVTWTPPTFTDNCSGGTITSNKASGSTFSKGATEVIYTATDGSGNTATCSFEVVVQDGGLGFSNCIGDITVQGNENCEAVVTWIEPTLNTNCNASSVTKTHAPGSTFPLGKTTVKYTAKDDAGNEATCSFNVIVSTKTVPVISDCPTDILLEANESGTARATWQNPNMSLPCGKLTTTSSHKSGDSFKIGNTVVTMEVWDDFGNKNSCSFNVKVVPPVLNLKISEFITPDGDGINDIWEVKNIEKGQNNKVIIVDRWGGVIFEASGYNNRSIVWDGSTLAGQKAPTGTYFYNVSVQTQSKFIKQTGSIELVR
jgi:gliding motility-associated-like protein